MKYGGEAASLAAGRLRAGARSVRQPHVTAAVDLLADHGYWLGRADFISECVATDGDRAFVLWHAARTFAQRETIAPPPYRKILDTVIRVGSNELLIETLSGPERRMLARAYLAALELDPSVVPA